MSNSLFILILGLALLPLLLWAYRVLPREEWQIIAALPTRKSETTDGSWHGTNLTYYGALLATGSLFGAMIFFLLLASLGVPMWGIIGLLLGGILLEQLLERLDVAARARADRARAHHARGLAGGTRRPDAASGGWPRGKGSS